MGTRSLLIEILGDAGGAQKAFKDTEAAQESFGSRFSDRAKKAMGAAGLAGSAALAKGFADNLNIDKGTDKLAASLGLTAAQAKDAGGVASRVYAGAWGDSLGEVNNAVGSVMSTLGRFTDGSKGIETMTTRALDFATAFDSDVDTAVGNAGILLETGLAKSGEQAFDLLAASMQKVPVAFRDELTEATKEYSQFFAGFGFSGEEMMGVLVEASKGGSYMVDKVGDSIKEASIKLRDGNKDTSSALASIFGMQEETDAFAGKFKQLTTDMASGGPKAKAAFTEIANAIMQIKDPVEKSQKAIAVFGTPFEDISGDATKMDEVLRTLATGSLPDVAGAAEKMGDTLNDNTATTFESFKRMLETKFAGIAGALGPIGAAAPALGGLVTTFDGLGGAVGKVRDGLGKVKDGLGSAAGKVADLGKGLGHAAVAGADFARTQGLAAANVAKTTGALVAQKVAAAAQAVATKAAAVAQGVFNAVMALNPIFLVVLAIVAFVAVLVLAYQKVGWFRDFVDAAFQLIGSVISGVISWVSANWPLLLAILTGPIGLAVLFITRNWDTIKAGFGAVVGWIGDKIGAVVGFFVAWHNRVTGVVGVIWGLLTGGASAAVGWVRDKLDNLVTFWTGLPGRLWNAARGMFDGLVSGFKHALNTIIRGWNNLQFRVPGFKIGPVGFDGFTLGMPDIPFLAKGGNITAGGLAMVGDDGPEVLDLPRGARVTPLGAAGGIGDLALTVPVVIDGREVARATVRFTREELLRMQTGRPLGFA